jgi:hypothetical protein
LTDCIAEAVIIQVKSSGIEYNSRLRHVVDKPSSGPDGPSGYAARKTSAVSDISLLDNDTASTQLETNATVEDMTGLSSFWYDIFLSAGTTQISPGIATQRLRDGAHSLLSDIGLKIDPQI